MGNCVTYLVGDGSDAVIQFEVQGMPRQGDRLVGRETGSEGPACTEARIEEVLGGVRQFGAKILEAVTQLAPTEAEAEFGVVFKGETNAIIAKTSAEGHVKITLRWKEPTASGGKGVLEPSGVPKGAGSTAEPGREGTV